MSFDGKVVLIPDGVSSGIGADEARHLPKLRAKISFFVRNEGRLSEVVEQIKKSGAPNPFVIVTDVKKG